MKSAKKWYLMLGVSLFLSLTFLSYTALVNGSMQELLSTDAGKAVMISMTVIWPISITVIAYILVNIFRSQYMRSNKKLMTFSIIILCVQIASHSLAFWCDRQAAENLHQAVMERLLKELQ